jgi:hypothetical protein
MESYTGPEIAALIDKDRIIVSRDIFTQMLETQLNETPLAAAYGYHHWIRGVYLITDVIPEDGVTILDCDSTMELNGLRGALDDNLELKTHGRQVRVVAGGSLSGVSPSDLKESLKSLRAPCRIVLKSTLPITCGDDAITAVNITRKVDRPPRQSLIDRAVDNVMAKFSGVRKVQITNYIGGPCISNEISTCIVTGGLRTGWTLVPSLEDALCLACSRGAKRCETQGNFGGGQVVTMTGLKSRMDINGCIGMTLKFDPDAARWAVCLESGERIKVKPANMLAVDSESSWGNVMIFWGTAKWTRTQLLGEIAKGDWGLCRAGVSEFTTNISSRWEHVCNSGRLAFAPVSDMTEEYIRGEGRMQMEAFRTGARLAAIEAGDDEQGDGDS